MLVIKRRHNDRNVIMEVSSVQAVQILNLFDCFSIKLGYFAEGLFQNTLDFVSTLASLNYFPFVDEIPNSIRCQDQILESALNLLDVDVWLTLDVGTVKLFFVLVLPDLFMLHVVIT